MEYLRESLESEVSKTLNGYMSKIMEDTAEITLVLHLVSGLVLITIREMEQQILVLKTKLSELQTHCGPTVGCIFAGSSSSADQFCSLATFSSIAVRIPGNVISTTAPAALYVIHPCLDASRANSCNSDERLSSERVHMESRRNRPRRLQRYPNNIAYDVTTGVTCGVDRLLLDLPLRNPA